MLSTTRFIKCWVKQIINILYQSASVGEHSVNCTDGKKVQILVLVIPILFTDAPLQMIIDVTAHASVTKLSDSVIGVAVEGSILFGLPTIKYIASSKE